MDRLIPYLLWLWIGAALAGWSYQFRHLIGALAGAFGLA